MIGLICIYFIGKYFYKVAKDYNKNRWLYSLLGILCFYVGSVLIGGMFFYFFAGKFWSTRLNFIFELPYLGVLKMPFGIVLACLIHYLLEANWKKYFTIADNEIDEIGK